MVGGGEEGGVLSRQKMGECHVQAFSVAEAECGVSNWQCLLPTTIHRPHRVCFSLTVGPAVGHLLLCHAFSDLRTQDDKSRS